jgi:hypothetical protein
MIVYNKDSQDYLLLANSSRGIMKIATDSFKTAAGITERVSDGTKGTPYETIEGWSGIVQLDLLDDMHAVVVRRDDAGALHLESQTLP